VCSPAHRVIRSFFLQSIRTMPFRSAFSSAIATPVPALTAGEWRDVQRALRAMQDSPCPQGENPGPWRRGLARIGRIVQKRAAPTVPSELAPLRDFLCESARHGPEVDKLAKTLEHMGYTPAQIAALSFIAG